MKKKVLLISSNHPCRDPRIDWEATTLAEHGYDVISFGINTEKSSGSENYTKNGYRIITFNKKWRENTLKLTHFFTIFFLNSSITGKIFSCFAIFINQFFIVFIFISKGIKGLFKFIGKLFRLNKRQKRKIKNPLRKLLFLPIYLYDSLVLINHFNHYLSFLFFELTNHIERLNTNFDLVHCNDLDTLLAGVALKRKTKCKLVYDAHELWPESIPQENIFLKAYLRYYEKSIIKLADASFIVSPQLLKIMKEWYGVKNIHCVPNAEIFKEGRKVYQTDIKNISGNKLIFLYQGGFAKYRGLEKLIEYWNYVDEKKAVLVIRGRKNSFLSLLKKLARKQVKKGSIIFDDPVDEDYLVNAAMEVDVGVIPYEPLNLNHKYGYFNKVSQYTQAGIAILNNSLPNVDKIVTEYECGLIYNADVKQSFIEAANRLITDKKLLSKLKRNSYNAGKKYINWQNLGKNYIKICDKLLR